MCVGGMSVTNHILSPMSAGLFRYIKNMSALCTDKKENQIFLRYKEIQSGAVAKSYRKKGFLICEEMCKYFPIYEEAVSHTGYDFATAPF